ncbi:MAG: hypothetical protein WAL86_04905 [Candidatus Acidiferrales bacterium]
MSSLLNNPVASLDFPAPAELRLGTGIKDALENRLHELVCGGQLDLGTAQRDISKDWIAAYKEYFHTDRPISN